jgi:hypothetical protein
VLIDKERREVGGRSGSGGLFRSAEPLAWPTGRRLTPAKWDLSGI